MKIGPLSLSKSTRKGYVRLGARIGSQRYRFATSHLWFDLPEEATRANLNDATPWLQAALPWAFHNGEALETDAEVDGEWIENAGEIMEIYSRWYPGLRPVAIRSSGECSSPDQKDGDERVTGLFFTGGVDSFYTLLSHGQSPEESEAGAPPIQDLVYVLGYGIPLRKRSALEAQSGELREVAHRTGKNLLLVATNLRKTILSDLDWAKIMHGPALAAAGIFLDRRLDKLLLSAGAPGVDSRPWGSHRLADRLMSTSRIRFVRYSADMPRFTKIEEISESRIAMDFLHVCWESGYEENCGTCEKCIRTLIALELLGAREKARSFPPGSILDRMTTFRISSPSVASLWEELEVEARERGRTDLAAGIENCLARFRETGGIPEISRFKQWKRRLRKALKLRVR